MIQFEVKYRMLGEWHTYDYMPKSITRAEEIGRELLEHGLKVVICKVEKTKITTLKPRSKP